MVPMRHASLALALLAPLLACPGDDQGGETGASPPSSTDAGTTAAMDSSSSAADPSTGPGGATMSAGSSGPPGDGSSSGGGPSPLDACVGTCERLIECGIERVPNCGIPCAGAPSMAAGCESEYVAQQECAAALSCDDLQAWTDAMIVPGAHPCEAEDEAYMTCETDGA
jgi:hypothetical protein